MVRKHVPRVPAAAERPKCCQNMKTLVGQIHDRGLHTPIIFLGVIDNKMLVSLVEVSGAFG